MTDFPVFVWREMMPDFRSWLVNFKAKEHVAPHAITERHIAEGYHRMCESTPPNGRMSEFTIIMNWAYSSPKWRQRYDWRISPFDLAFGMSLHHANRGKQDAELVAEGRGCPRREDIMTVPHLRDALLFYPNFDRVSFDLRHKSWKRVHTNGKPLAGPLLTEHNDTSTVDQSYATTLANTAVDAAASSTVRWTAMIQQHDINLASWHRQPRGRDPIHDGGARWTLP